MDWLKWITDDVRNQRRDELFQLGFEWEVNHRVNEHPVIHWNTNWIHDSGWRFVGVPDESLGAWYGSDYFIERDLVF